MQRLLFIAWLVAVGCNYDWGTDHRTTGQPSASDRFPRLTHAQWEATVTDLFRLDSASGLSSTFTPDPQLGRFDNNIARLSMTSGLWRDYQLASETIAERVTSDAAIYGALVPVADARDFIPRFGLRAFRRPLTEGEIGRYLVLFEGAPAVFPTVDPFKAGVRMIVQSMLQSPFFLYRAELSAVKSGVGIPLDNYEMASRLSYTFWNTMPDDELFAAAAAGELMNPDGVRRHATRLLDDPRAQAQLRNFHFQAFHISEYADLDKNTTLFPNWRREIGPMMQEEALRFLDDIVANNRGVSDVLTSTKAYVNADLAKIYGLQGTFGTDYELVELDSATRAGLLTRAGFLAKNATLTEPDPIHRGVSINLGVICRPIAAPPDIPDELMRVGNTNRERVNSITGEGTCGNMCHGGIINPIGFAFENYDAVGAWRTMDNGYPVDAAATYEFLDGRTISYTNAIDLSKQLATAPEVHACYSQQLFEFVMGRDLLQVDRVMVKDLAKFSLQEQASIKELVIEVVTSTPFRVRSIEGSQP